MQASDCFNKLCSVKTSSSFRELCLLSKMKEKFASIQEIHNEVEFCVGLESIVQLYNEGTVNFLKDVSFSYGYKSG